MLHVVGDRPHVAHHARRLVPVVDSNSSRTPAPHSGPSSPWNTAAVLLLHRFDARVENASQLQEHAVGNAEATEIGAGPEHLDVVGVVRVEARLRRLPEEADTLERLDQLVVPQAAATGAARGRTRCRSCPASSDSIEDGPPS